MCYKEVNHIETIETAACAKINLTLDVLGKRPDGYHNLHSVMQTVGLCDKINITLNNEGSFAITSNKSFLPKDTRNLALAAARLFLGKTGQSKLGASVVLEKQIPVCAGLGGGSADAGAVLRCMGKRFHIDDAQLRQWALELGSDVPFCVNGGTAIANGRGEELTPLEKMPPCFVVLSRPDIFVSTREVFGAVPVSKIKRHPNHTAMLKALEAKDWREVSHFMFNVFQEPLEAKHKIIGRIHRYFIDSGALGSSMSGTGPTVFALFDDNTTAVAAYNQLKKEIPDTFLTCTV